jgi:hypothetical protein
LGTRPQAPADIARRIHDNVRSAIRCHVAVITQRRRRQSPD